jgi:UDP-N-acetylglucosamine acyltransferase
MNNFIDSSVIIYDNVVIGNNNIIKANTIIYENTVIGNNNIILEYNILGCLPVEANIHYEQIKSNGLIIGNNNFFHISNKISSGYYDKTIIGDNNKLLSDVYISHDNIIHNNITFYPRVFSAGIVEYFDNANIGAGAYIHQKCKVGSYSMIGMNCTITKNVLPFFVNINNKNFKLNKHKLPNGILEYSDLLNKILLSDNKLDYIKLLPDKYKLYYNNII